MSSAQNIALSTNDLRARSIDYQRDAEHKHKWAYGKHFGPGRRFSEEHPAPVRIRCEPKGYRRDGIAVATAKHRGKVAAWADVHEYVGSDSSADEDVVEPSAAPEPDADILYSYDNKSAPSHGSQVLNQALAKAVERFEVRETDNLIKNEYEVLDEEGEPVAPAPKGKGKAKKVVAAVTPQLPEEDDYEFV